MLVQTQNKLGSIAHPLVSAMYLKRDFSVRDSHRRHDVLVIETSFPVASSDRASFKACLGDLLSDLPDIRTQAEARVGPIGRVEIRPPH